MNVKLKVLRKVLEEAIANIDAGNSNHSDDELDDIISSLTKLNRGIKRISKREACERILHCSPSSFDNYIKLGLIPRGHKEYGFKELLAKDETYISIERELQLMIQEELINSVKDKVAASPRGKELLEKQLNNIKVKKEEIIKEANKNIEVFKRFQEAARLNPNLTYAEFVKSLN